MTPEQQKALALARARRRRAEAQGQPEATAAQAPAASRDMGALAASNRGVEQGLTFSFGDELMAGAMAPVEAVVGGVQGKGFGLGDAYNRNLERERAMLEQARESSPVATGVGEVAGALMTGGGLAKGGATLVGRTAGKGLATRVGAGMAEGAAYGGAYGFGSGEGGAESRLENAKSGAITGGVVGGALPVAGAAMRKPFDAAARRATIKNAPTNDQLRATAKAAYQTADDAGLQFSQRGYMQLAQGIEDSLSQGGYNRRLNPKIAAVLKEVEGMKGQAPTLQRLEQLRRVALNAQKSIEPSDKALAGRVIENIDQFVERISPRDIVAGTGREKAVSALREARGTWRKLRKSEMLDEAFEKAGDQASGFENGLRTQFRSLLGNKKTRKMFSEQEQAAMRRVIRGGPVENVLRLLGRFAPKEGPATNAVGFSIGMGGGAYAGGLAGGPVGGAVGAIAVPAIGSAARKGAQAATRSNAELARALVRSGKIAESQYPRVIEALNSGQLDPAMLAGSVAASQ